jgi:hypothetical protein
MLRPRLFVMTLILIGLAVAAHPHAGAGKKPSIRIIIPGGDPTAFVPGAYWTPVAGDTGPAWAPGSLVHVVVTQDGVGTIDEAWTFTEGDGSWAVEGGVYLPTPENVEYWGLITATVADGADWHVHAIKFVMLVEG